MPANILLAEDDVFLAEMLIPHLEDIKDVTVETAKNGEEAIAAIDASQPDLLLLDLLMPKVDGFGVLEHIREKKYSFPIIILSNLAQEIDIDKYKTYGVRGCFVKSDSDVHGMHPISWAHF